MSPRREDLPPLRRSDLAPDPVEQFTAWYARAAEEVPLAEAMTLATVAADGGADARMVLLKGHGPDGFRFFTNHESAKAAQLAASPDAALLFYWRELDRQVRIRGPVRRMSGPESDAYFATRPRDSRLGAWASPQSRIVAGRGELDRLLAEVERRFQGEEEVPRPEHWGGYVLEPVQMEFWQGRRGRLHDRFLYRRGADRQWSVERLGP